jgi:alpha-1,2-mannosyltransferase
MMETLMRTLKYAVLIFLVSLLIVWIYIMNIKFMIREHHYNDFGKIYASATYFLQGKDMYGPSEATNIKVTKTLRKQFYNLNPPHLHILILPLTIFSIHGAFIIWGVASVIALVISLRVIQKEVGFPMTPWRFLVILFGVLMFIGTPTVCVTGQMSLLLLLPVTYAWREARRGRWTNAGIFLGAVASVKPFMLVFLPYLILRREFRAAAAACVMIALSFLAGILVFGIPAHASWIDALSSVDWSWATMNGSLMGILTRTLKESPYFSPFLDAPYLIQPLWLGLTGILGALTMMISVRDSSDIAVDRGFAILLVFAHLASPLGWIYYLWFLAGPLSAVMGSFARKGVSETGPGFRNITGFRKGCVLAASVGLVWPLFATLLFQPSPWATVSIGSVYFWTCLIIWIGLAADYLVPDHGPLKLRPVR